MKVVVLGLMILAISLAPAYGQLVPQPTIEENSASENEAVSVTDESEASQLDEMPDSANSFSMMRTLGSMGIVICLMIGIYFAAKKFAPKYFVKNSPVKNMKILETLSMGDRRTIALVEVANMRILVGTTPHQVNFLTTLPEPVSLVSEPEQEHAKPSEMFRDDVRTHFRKLFEVEKKQPVSDSVHPLPDDLRTKMRQLREALER